MGTRSGSDHNGRTLHHRWISLGPCSLIESLSKNLRLFIEEESLNGILVFTSASLITLGLYFLSGQDFAVGILSAIYAAMVPILAGLWMATYKPSSATS